MHCRHRTALPRTIRTRVNQATQTLADFAALPFRMLESRGLSSGYERSFKLSDSSLLANRYLLGVEQQALGKHQWAEVCRELAMPKTLRQEFLQGLARANLVLLGFEAQANGQALFKLYLEYWDELQSQIMQGFAPPRALLHRGFKWSAGQLGQALITDYHCLPGLSIQQIRENIAAHYKETRNHFTLRASLAILALASQKAANTEFLYIDISEAGNPRQSFDLNLYPAGIRMHELCDIIYELADQFDIDQHQIHQLMPLIKDKLFGHLSAGIGRDGNAYLSLYYEC